MNNSATTQPAPLTACVLPASDLRSIFLRIRNESQTIGEVVFPNPYTGVNLLTLEHKVIPRCSFFAWEQNDPRLQLRPGDEVAAILNLAPFWMDVAGDVLVRCRIVWRLPMEEDLAWFVEGPMKLEFDSFADLARRIRSRQTTTTTTVSATPKLMNVSDYITIQETAGLLPVVRDEPVRTGPI